jgi:regulatory protein
MARVERLRRRRAGDPMVDIELEGGERLRVHERRILEHRLETGAEVGGAGLAALRSAAASDATERRALRLIARRPRSRAEMRRRLEEWGIDHAQAREVLERLTAVGALDDGALARAIGEERRRAGHGRLRVEADLDRLAVAAHARPEAAGGAQDETARARGLVELRYGPPPYDRADRRRAAALLVRRGFDADTVEAVLGDPEGW